MYQSFCNDFRDPTIKYPEQESLLYFERLL